MSTTETVLTLLDNQSQHVGLLIVRLRETITSARRGAAQATEPVVSVKSERQVSNAPRPASGDIQPPVKSATPKQDPENDIVELLNHVVCKIKAVLDETPEMSEVRVGSIHNFDKVTLTFSCSFTLMQTPHIMS